VTKRKDDVNKRKDDVKKHRQVHETNEWVQQQNGQVFAPESYVDAHGVLRAISDDSVAAWHLAASVRARHGLEPCTRRGLSPSELVYDEATGAPWCPVCWPVALAERDIDDAKRKEAAIAEMFGNN
jgi:hypothetical protein